MSIFVTIGIRVRKCCLLNLNIKKAYTKVLFKFFIELDMFEQKQRPLNLKNSKNRI